MSDADELYRLILAEAKRLERIGAVSQRGRPPIDTDQLKWTRQSRAWEQAIKNMPPEFRKEWREYCKTNDIIGVGRATIHAEQRAYSRGFKRLEDSQTPIKVPDLKAIRRSAIAPAQQAKTDTRKARLADVLAAVQSVERAGDLVKTKTVLREFQKLHGRDYPGKADTIRKDIREIRRLRHG